MSHPIWYRLVHPDHSQLPNTDDDKLLLGSMADVVDLKQAVWKENECLLKPQVDSSGLKVYKNQASLAANEPLRFSASVVGLGESYEDPVVIVVPLPPSVPEAALTQNQRIYVFQSFENCRQPDEGIDANSTRILSRAKVVEEAIHRLGVTNVLLFKSTPMTGKSSTATLVAHELDRRYRDTSENVIILNFSIAQFSGPNAGWKFTESFDSLFRFTWESLLLSAQRYARNRTRVFLIIDEGHLMCKSSESIDANPVRPSSAHECSPFWTTIKTIGTYDGHVQILIFSAYGAGVQNSEWTPTELRHEAVAMHPHLTDDEVCEYIEKNLDFTTANMEDIARWLQMLVGNHVGLLSEAVKQLNEANKESLSNTAKNLTDLKSIIWGNAMYKALTCTRAVQVLKSDDVQKLHSAIFSEKGIEPFVKRGILVEVVKGLNWSYVWSSSIMYRFYTEKLMGDGATRAEISPNSILDLIVRTLGAINYASFRSSFSKTVKTEIILERAWQMEFYQAAYRVTPNAFTISPDVGKIHNDTGFIDFTIHSANMETFWGIELLRERNVLINHLKRFQAGGGYDNMLEKFSQFCVIDFRRMKNGMDWKLDDLKLSKHLIIVTYDIEFRSVAAHYTDSNGVPAQVQIK